MLFGMDYHYLLLGQRYYLFLNCKLYCNNFLLSGEFAITFLAIVLMERGIKIALLTWGGREGGGYLIFSLKEKYYGFSQLLCGLTINLALLYAIFNVRQVLAVYVSAPIR